MNRNRSVIGLLLVVTGIVLYQLDLGNDLADFIMGILVSSGLIILITELKKSKSKKA